MPREIQTKKCFRLIVFKYLIRPTSLLEIIVNTSFKKISLSSPDKCRLIYFLVFNYNRQDNCFFSFNNRKVLLSQHNYQRAINVLKEHQLQLDVSKLHLGQPRNWLNCKEKPILHDLIWPEFFRRTSHNNCITSIKIDFSIV